MSKKQSASAKPTPTLEVTQATTAQVVAIFDPPNATNKNLTLSLIHISEPTRPY